MNLRLSSLPAVRRPLSRLAGLGRPFPLTRERLVRAVRTRSFAIALYAALGSSVLAAAALQTKIVRVVDSSGTHVVYTFRSDPDEILRQSGIQVSANDTYSFTGIRNHYGQIRFYAAFPVPVTADGKDEKIMFANGTVADVLKKAGVALGADDEISVPLDTRVTEDTRISIARVKYEQTSATTPTPFTVETVPDSSLAQGRSAVLREGQNGSVTVVNQLKYVDGALKGQTELSRTEVPAVSKKVAVGTAVVQTVSKAASVAKTDKSTTGLSASGGVPASYKKIITGVATAYTQKSGTRTATGRAVAKGLVAVNPDVIPYGTKLYIATPNGSYVYGNAVAADTGGFVTNGSGILTDLFFPTSAEVAAFGKRTVNIYVLD